MDFPLGVNRIPHEMLTGLMRFFEEKSQSCLWMAGFLNSWDQLSEERKEGWLFLSDVAFPDEPSTVVAVEANLQLAFMASLDTEGEPFEKISDHLVANLDLRKLCGPEETLAAHLSDHQEWGQKVYRQHRQYTMTLDPAKIDMGKQGRLRPARLEDLPALKRHERIYNAERQVRLRRNYAAEIKEGSIFVYPMDGEDSIAGVVKMGYPSDKYVMVLGTFVFPEFRMQGFGARMMEDLCRLIYQMTGLTAALNVDDDNEPALGLYEKLGFDTIGHERILYLSK